jgi:hypothetical protein
VFEFEIGSEVKMERCVWSMYCFWRWIDWDGICVCERIELAGIGKDVLLEYWSTGWNVCDRVFA